MAIDEFSTFEVVKILNIKRERLKDWMERGFIKPSRQEEIGPGLKSYFSRWDLYMIELFKYLVENGLSRKNAAVWIENINTKIPIPPFIKETIRFITIARIGGQVVYLGSVWSGNSVNIDPDLDDVVVINFRRIQEKIDESIMHFEKGVSRDAI